MNLARERPQPDDAYPLMTSIELNYPLERGFEAGTEIPREGGRRVLNIVVATIALILTAPLFLVVAVVVWATSDGPILFSQTRIGLDRRLRSREPNHQGRRFDCGGQPFRILKFRTMHLPDPEDHTATWATPNDPRVTSVGRWLRKLRLDELPQLINVLTGDMNIVGPRPEQPRIFADLRGVITEYDLRQAVRPGITGLAQINQSYDQTLDDVRSKLSWDLEYIRRQSTIEDLRIMIRTIPVILNSRGAW